MSEPEWILDDAGITAGDRSWEGLTELLKDAPTVTISGRFLTDVEQRALHESHMAACQVNPCAECGMGSCGEYHHLGPRGNGACNEQWCPSDREPA